MPDSLEERELALEVKKLQVSEASLRLSKFSIAASVLAACVGLGSLVFSIFAERAASEAESKANDVQQANDAIQQNIELFKTKLDTINTNTNSGQAQIGLIQVSVTHLENMVDLTLDLKERQRHCSIAGQFARVERDKFGNSGHITALLELYLEKAIAQDETSNENDLIQNMCQNRWIETFSASPDQPLNDVVLERAPETFTAPNDPNTIADRVVVLASYRSKNCTIAQNARDALKQRFDEPLVVALSRSNHYSVVYSPTADETDINEFLDAAREKGNRALIEIAEGSADDIDQQNLQYVADAFVASTSGWNSEPISECPAPN